MIKYSYVSGRSHRQEPVIQNPNAAERQRSVPVLVSLDCSANRRGNETRQGDTIREVLHEVTIALLRRLTWILRLLDLSNEQFESFAHVLVISGARFGPAALKLLRYLLPFLSADLSLFGSKIALVSYNDNWNRLGALSLY